MNPGKILKMPELSSSVINTAAQLLRDGGLVAFPTETVYGLGADACNPEAVRRIFEVKGRPADHPLILHLARSDSLDYWARDIPEAAWRLAERFWPGPLTLVLRRRCAPLAVTGGQDTVGLRVPGHPVALALLEAFGGGIAAPSANRFGRVSPTRAQHVRKELQGEVDMILEGGPCRVGLESTIISLAGERPQLLRSGAIPVSALQEALGEELTAPTADQGLRAPGMLASHYAPNTRLEVWPLEALKRRSEELARFGRKAIAILIDRQSDAMPDQSAGSGFVHQRKAGSREGMARQENPTFTAFSMPAEPGDYARRLYVVLRLLDGAGYDVLLAESPPNTEAWQAVNDRLRRASCRRGEPPENVA
jgi:L-threonylcarbamoyladenylate synthase